MNDLIQRLVNGIIRQEGMAPTALNPGNLRAAPWLKFPVVRNGFWVPGSRAEGISGAAHVVALRVAMGQTLTQLISAWAPATDKNNTAVYIHNMALWCGIPDVNVPLYTFIESFAATRPL